LKEAALRSEEAEDSAGQRKNRKSETRMAERKARAYQRDLAGMLASNSSIGGEMGGEAARKMGMRRKRYGVEGEIEI
jgi:hypothetical protein